MCAVVCSSLVSVRLASWGLFKSRRAAEPAESATKIVSIFFQNGSQFERLIINQIYDIHYQIQGFLGILEAWLRDHEENFFFEVIC